MMIKCGADIECIIQMSYNLDLTFKKSIFCFNQFNARAERARADFSLDELYQSQRG